MTMKIDDGPGAKCSAKFWPRGAWHARSCNNDAKVIRDGKHYCRSHDPEAIKKRIAKRDAKYQEGQAKRAEAWQRQRDYPAMKEQRDRAVELLRMLTERSEMVTSGVAECVELIGFHSEAREFLAALEK